MKWFLLVLLCLSFVSADLLSIGTGEDEVSFGYGNIFDLFFSGLDIDVPIITRISPDSTLTTTEFTQTYSYNVSSDNNIASCSLLMDGLSVSTDNLINQLESNSFIYTQSVGSYVWSIECSDENSNTGTTDNFSIQFYVDTGGGSGSSYNYYSECYNITDGECGYTAFYDEPCPGDYFLSLSACMDFILLEEINQSTLDMLIELTDILIQGENKTETTKEIIETLNRIPSDISRYFSIIALKITPSNELLGKWIICIFIIFLLFSREIIKLGKNVRLKNEW